jgi:HAD superfamily hydrolase (TIGR01509 family)
MKIEAILFDCDGVLIDTEKPCREIMANLLTQKYNYPITTQEALARWNGKSVEHIAQELVFEGCSFVEDFVEEGNKITLDLKLDENSIVPHILNILDRFAEKPKVVCSNGRSFRLIEHLKQVDLFDKFDLILGRDIVGDSKPNPTIYLQGAERLGVDIKKCVVIEDSALGLQAGVESGAITIGFTGSGTDKKELEKVNPDYIASNMLEVAEILEMLDK